MSRPTSRMLVAVLAALLATPAIPLRPAPVAAVSPNIVISQVYGGGGNAGATFTNDFIELFNRGATSVDSRVERSVRLVQPARLGTGRTYRLGCPRRSTTSFRKRPARAAPRRCRHQRDRRDRDERDRRQGRPRHHTDHDHRHRVPGRRTSRTSSATGAANCFEGAAAPAALQHYCRHPRGSGCTDTDANNTDFTAGAPTPRNTSLAR